MWDPGSPVTLIAILCIVAAAIGGGVQFTGHEIPIINSKVRQAILAAIGCALLLVPYLESNYFGQPRVVDVKVRWDSGAVVWACKTNLRYTVTITTHKIDHYSFRTVFYNGLSKSKIEAATATADGTQTFERALAIDLKKGDSAHHYGIFVEVLSPNEVTSDTANIRILCG